MAGRAGILAYTTFDPRRENQGGFYWYTEDIRVPTLWDAARQAGMTLIGPGVPAGRSLGSIDMRDVAPTLARRLGLTLPAADGKILLP